MKSGNPWHVRIPAEWLTDKRVVELSWADRGMLIGMVTLSFNQGSKGSLTEAQIRHISPPKAKVREGINSLIAAELVEKDPENPGSYRVVRPQEWGITHTVSAARGPRTDSVSPPSGDRTDSVSRQSQRRTDAVSAQRRSADGFKLAAQMIAGSKNAFHNDPDALKEEKRKEESIRSPSGSDRMDSAQAAPRDADGAAQPAPEEQKKNLQPLGEFEDDSENDAVLFAGIEHLSGKDKAFAILAKHRKNNKHSTGRDVPLRRREWTPNRMIEPTDTAELFPGREWPEPSE